MAQGKTRGICPGGDTSVRIGNGSVERVVRGLSDRWAGARCFAARNLALRYEGR